MIDEQPHYVLRGDNTGLVPDTRTRFQRILDGPIGPIILIWLPCFATLLACSLVLALIEMGLRALGVWP